MSIDAAKIQEYRDSVIHLAQQGEARVRPTVTEIQSSAEFYNWDRLAATDAVERTKSVKNKETLVVDEDFTRRTSTPRVFEHNFTFEDYDKAEMAIDPQSSYTENQGMSMRRAYDTVCIEAATADALEDGVATPLPAGQIIGDGTTEISFNALTVIQRKFMDAEIFPDTPKVAVIGPGQVQKLMQLTEQTSGDYVTREALQRLNATGIVPNWMGFTWIVSNLLTAPDTNELYCLFYTKMAIGLQVNMNMKVRVGENPDKSYNWNVFSQFSAGAVRVEDEHIVVGHFADPAPTL
jgi:hypothetical protein